MAPSAESIRRLNERFARILESAENIPGYSDFYKVRELRLQTTIFNCNFKANEMRGEANERKRLKNALIEAIADNIKSAFDSDRSQKITLATCLLLMSFNLANVFSNQCNLGDGGNE